MSIIGSYGVTEVSRLKYTVKLLGVNIAALILLLLFLKHPVSSGVYPKCVWYSFTHTYCPGCGSLRGLYRFLGGDISGLYKSNKLAFLLAPVLFYSYLDLTAKSFFGLGLPLLKLNSLELKLFLALIIAYWAARNYFTFLAPA